MNARHARASCVLLVLAAATAHAALPQRTFVASTGNDANPCSLTLPCRGFDTAIGKVASGGEVVALDSAGYGAMTITQPVSVIAPPGVHAAITVSGITAVAISAPANSPVTLRGLAISTLTGGASGIYNLSGANLRVENCSVDGFDYNVAHGGPGTLHIVDSRLTRGAVGIGGFGGTVIFSVERTYMTPGPGSQFTVLVAADSRGAIRDSTIKGDGSSVSYGIRTTTNSTVPAPVELQVENTLIAGHAYGVYSDAFGGSYSSVALSNSQLIKNTFAVNTSNNGTAALVSSRIAHNQVGVTISGGGGPVYTDGRNWFGYNNADLNGSISLSGPGGLR